MRRLVLLCFAGLLTSCASASDTKGLEPTITYASTKTPAELKDCVVQAASATTLATAPGPVIPPIVIPRGADYRITFLGDQRLFAEVSPTATGSRLNYFRLRRDRLPSSTVDAAVQSCS